MKKKGNKTKIVEYLNYHVDEPVKSNVLAEIAGYPNKGSCPELREAIRELIREGHYIASNDKGFFITYNIHVMKQYEFELGERVEGILTRIKHLQANRRKWVFENSGVLIE